MGLLALCLFVYVRFDWRHAPPGQLTAFVAIVYGVGRFPLDFLRAADARYFGLTPAQLACLTIVATGIWLWRRSTQAAVRECNE
jgi:prolipoprotein diacylglyceryltransferase